MPSISFGAIKTKIDSIDLGSVLSSDLVISKNVIPIYTGGADPVFKPKTFLTNRLQGTFSVSTDDSTASFIFDKMISNLLANGIQAVNFNNHYISGNLFIIPQFSVTAQLDGFTSISFNFPIKDISVAQQGTTQQAKTCDLDFVSFEEAAVTANTDNILVAANVNGISASSISVVSKCDYELLYNDSDTANISPVACIIRSAYVEADISLIDFSSIADIDTKATINLLDIKGDSCGITIKDITSYVSGLKTSNGINSWQVKVIGSI